MRASCASYESETLERWFETTNNTNNTNETNVTNVANVTNVPNEKRACRRRRPDSFDLWFTVCSQPNLTLALARNPTVS